MTLGELLNKLDRSFPEILYRTIINLPDEGDVDILTGGCRYIHTPFPRLEPLDGDNYSLDDEICDYVVRDDSLIVWYESELIHG